MHELAIIEETFRIILKIAGENQLERINSVTMEIGEYRQVDPSIFRFAFDASKAGTIASDARLDIEFQPLEMKCDGCGNIFPVKKSTYKCPRCGNGRLQAVKGMDIFIKNIEGE
jgi:hydrogenase nickel incorporation protein HypA/HybF